MARSGVNAWSRAREIAIEPGRLGGGRKRVPRTPAGRRIIAGSSTMVNAMAGREITLEDLVTFQLGEMGEGIALVLAYATSGEKLRKGEMETFAIGMTQEKAAELGRALVEIAGKAPGAGGPRGREH